jgi:hypothetical protein
MAGLGTAADRDPYCSRQSPDAPREAANTKCHSAGYATRPTTNTSRKLQIAGTFAAFREQDALIHLIVMLNMPTIVEHTGTNRFYAHHGHRLPRHLHLHCPFR